MTSMTNGRSVTRMTDAANQAVWSPVVVLIVHRSTTMCALLSGLSTLCAAGLIKQVSKLSISLADAVPSTA